MTFRTSRVTAMVKIQCFPEAAGNQNMPQNMHIGDSISKAYQKTEAN